MPDEVNPPQLLVADDDPTFRSMVRRTLEANDWCVTEAADGDAAHRAVAANSFALVLIAIGSPGLDGIATTRLIRSGDVRKALVPILAVSSASFGRSDRHVRMPGTDGSLVKPLTPGELLGTVDAWRPSGDAGSSKLAHTFGEAAAAALVATFADELVEALVCLDAEQPCQAIAHRLAGAAGMLGFPDIHAPWLALSEGDDSALEPARRAARKMLSTLAQQAGISPSH